MPSVAGGDRWGVLALVICARVVLAIQQQSVGALGPALLADPGLELTYAGLGALIGAYMLPGVFVALPAGWLTSRLGDRHMVSIGLGLGVLGGVAFAAAPTFETVFAARLASGAGSALLNVVGSTMVMARFSGRTLAPAMGGILAAYPFGLGTALVALPAFAAVTGSWRGAMLVAAAACAAVLLAVPLVTKAAPSAAAPEPNSAGVRNRRGFPRTAELWPLLAVATAWVAVNAGFAVLLGFTPALLTERGMSAETAGAMASLVGWMSIPLAPLGGAIAERTGWPLLATTACLTATAAAVFGLAAGVGPQAAALLAVGLFVSIAATVIMTLPARALTPENRAIGMGVFYTLFYVGMAALPPIAGWAAAATAGAAAAIYVAAAFFVVSVAAVAVCAGLLARRRSDTHIPSTA